MNLVGVQYVVIFVDLPSREILSDRQTWVNFVDIIWGKIPLTRKHTITGDFWQKLIVNESVDKRLHVSFVSERRAMSLIHDHKFYWWILIRNNHWSLLVGKHTLFIMTSMKAEFCWHTSQPWKKKGGAVFLASSSSHNTSSTFSKIRRFGRVAPAIFKLGQPGKNVIFWKTYCWCCGKKK